MSEEKFEEKFEGKFEGNSAGNAGESAEREIPGPAPPDRPGRRQDPVTGFLEQVEDHLEGTGMAASTFGILAAGDSSLVLALRKGRVCRLGTACH